MRLPSAFASPEASDRVAATLRRVRHGLMFAGAVYVVGMLGGDWLSQYWRIGVDLQDETRCLPYYVWVVKLGAPERIEKGRYVALVPAGEMGMGVDDLVRKAAFPRFLIKQVAGVPGDAIVVIGNEARMGGQEFGPLTLTTLNKVPVVPGGFDRVEIVPEGRIAVAGTLPRAYDSRYWGTAGKGEVVGEAFPIF